MKKLLIATQLLIGSIAMVYAQNDQPLLLTPKPNQSTTTESAIVAEPIVEVPATAVTESISENELPVIVPLAPETPKDSTQLESPSAIAVVEDQPFIQILKPTPANSNSDEAENESIGQTNEPTKPSESVVIEPLPSIKPKNEEKPTTLVPIAQKQVSIPVNNEIEDVCLSMDSQEEIDQCMAARYSQQSLEMDRIYQEAMSAQIANNKEALRTAQKAWTAFRNHYCDCEKTLYTDSSIELMMYYKCLTRLTEQQVVNLSQMLE